jgi:hypothetical protein
MSRRLLSIVIASAAFLPGLATLGCSSSGQKPYGLTGSGGGGGTPLQKQAEMNRRADEQRSPYFRKAVNVAPSYPA